MGVYGEAILPEYEKLGQIRQPTGSALPGIAPSNVYPTADGQWVVIGANADNVFARFATALGHPEWAAEGAELATHRGRGACQTELDDAIACRTRERTVDVVLRVMDAESRPVASIPRLISPSIRSTPVETWVIEVPEPRLDGESVRIQGVVPKLSETPGHVARGGPLLGEHNTEIWGALVGAERLAELIRAHIV